MIDEGSADRHRGVRNALRLIGGVLLVAGVILAGVGFTSFFSAFGGDAPPDKFWMCFVGLPLVAIGGWCLLAGFLGSISDYAANETAPVWARMAAILAPGGNQPGRRSSVEGSGRFCSSCGAPAGPGARFCASCGAPAG